MTGPAFPPIAPAAWMTAGPPAPGQEMPPGPGMVPIGADWAERSILDHLAALAVAAPEAACLADGERMLTRAAVLQAARRLGAALRAQPWPPGAVGVLLPNDARYVTAQLGVLAAGRPCMLLGPQMPAALLARIAADAVLVGVVATADLAPRLAGGLPVLAAEPALSGRGAAPPPAPPAPDAPAFIVSTSGTTGVPKAVVRTQRAMLANHAHRIRDIALDQRDRVVSIGAPATAGVLSHRLYSLVGGACVAVLDPGALGLSGVLAGMRGLGATVLHATPLAVRALAGLPGAAEAFATLRLVMLGGDTLLQADLAALRRVLPPPCRVHFGFGLGESARIASWFVPDEDRRDQLRVASGYLRAGIAAMVVDEAGQPLPPGEAGELVVSTPFAAVGEWSAGRVVPARFAADPLHPGRRIVRTGDIVRLGADGVLLVLGRADRMVKIGGQRVEPAAIELAMRGVPGVAEAGVLALHEGGAVRLAGFVVPDPEAAAEGAALLTRVRAALWAGLLPHMMPARLHVVPVIPLTAAGKRDDAALAALAPA